MTNPLNRGVMLISLDLELAWGTRGRPSAPTVGPFLDGTRYAVEQLLGLCETYEIPITWVVVGSLLMGKGPNDVHPWLSDECFADIPRGTASTQPRWYAEDILEMIQQCKTPQEIGCHTLTHQFVDPTPAGREAFRRELQRFRQLFDELGLEQPITFIYPKARMGHFDVIAEAGFRCFRGPEPRWHERIPNVPLSAAFRMIDGILAVRPNIGLPCLTPEGLWMLPSSQYYPPLVSVGRYVSVAQRARKASKGLHAAAHHRKIFHLWTHPFNLGQRTEELLSGLEKIFQETSRMREAGSLETLTMGELTHRLDKASAAREG